MSDFDERVKKYPNLTHRTDEPCKPRRKEYPTQANVPANDTRFVLCVDIGGTSTKLGYFDLQQRITLVESIPTRGPAPEFANALCAAIRCTFEAVLMQGIQVSGIGIAIAGLLNDRRDRMVYNSNLPWLEDFPLLERLEQDFAVPIVLEVDSNAAALAEFHLGAGQGSSRFLCAAVGTGLGIGVIVKGEPLRFSYGCVGDPGHIIVQPNGPLCSCGGRGCAEVFVSAPLLAEKYRLATAHAGPCSLRTVIENARRADAVAISILDEAGEWLGIACASLANTFFPDSIAVAGGFAEAGDLVLGGLHRSFQIHASQFAKDRVSIARATLGAMATLTGAAYPVLALSL